MTLLAFFGQPGTWQILLVLAVLVLLFGANRLPKLARNLGSSLTEFRKGLRGESDEGDDDGEQKIDKPNSESDSDKG